MSENKSYGTMDNLEQEFIISGVQVPEKEHLTVHVQTKHCHSGVNLALLKYAACIMNMYSWILIKSMLFKGILIL